MEYILYAKVGNGGQTIYQVEIDFGDFKPHSIDTDTFTIKASGSSKAFQKDESIISYNDYKDIERTIIETKIEGHKVILTLKENEVGSFTFAYLSLARNVPIDIEYHVIQNKDIQGEDGHILPIDTQYYWKEAKDHKNGRIMDDETRKFISIKKEITYQFYELENQPKQKSLIVWFHGNAESDCLFSKNNVTQMIANRGTVAWATKEAQEAFDGAYVMAFQAPETWYYAQSKGYLKTAYDEIMEVVKKYDIAKDRLFIAGCSAGGYMTTRMILAYPTLFQAAAIVCQALDVATKRGGQTPTDEELNTLKHIKTKIWLVQADNDTVVKTVDCADRIYRIVGEGKETISTIQGGYTYEKDNIIYTKYNTVKKDQDAMFTYQEDNDHDGVMETVYYPSHWTWIHASNNDPVKANGMHLWQWLGQRREQ